MKHKERFRIYNSTPIDYGKTLIQIHF